MEDGKEKRQSYFVQDIFFDRLIFFDKKEFCEIKKKETTSFMLKPWQWSTYPMYRSNQFVFTATLKRKLQSQQDSARASSST